MVPVTTTCEWMRRRLLRTHHGRALFLYLLQGVEPSFCHVWLPATKQCFLHTIFTFSIYFPILAKWNKVSTEFITRTTSTFDRKWTTSPKQHGIQINASRFITAIQICVDWNKWLINKLPTPQFFCYFNKRIGKRICVANKPHSYVLRTRRR